jgi:archaellum biogenesis ATPase FlaH
LTGGGVRWGTGLVLVGPSGTGKSTIGTQIVSAAAHQGYKTCAFLFDEAKATYIKRAKNVDLDLASHMREGIIEIHPVAVVIIVNTPCAFRYASNSCSCASRKRILSGIPRFVGETQDLMNFRPGTDSKGATAG